MSIPIRRSPSSSSGSNTSWPTPWRRNWASRPGWSKTNGTSSFPALERGNFDIILNGLELTAENQQRIAMSQPYFVYAQQIVTRQDTAGLDRMDALKGKAVGRALLLRRAAAARGHGRRGPAGIYPGNVESFRDLKAGASKRWCWTCRLPCTMRKPDAELKFSGAPFAPGYYGIGVRKEDTTLLAALNQAIEELADDHTLERIYRKYGVWDERQSALKDYKPEAVAAHKPHFHAAGMAKVLALAAARSGDHGRVQRAGDGAGGGGRAGGGAGCGFTAMAPCAGWPRPMWRSSAERRCSSSFS